MKHIFKEKNVDAASCCSFLCCLKGKKDTSNENVDKVQKHLKNEPNHKSDEMVVNATSSSKSFCSFLCCMKREKENSNENENVGMVQNDDLKRESKNKSDQMVDATSSSKCIDAFLDCLFSCF